MLQPKRQKFRKAFRGRRRGKAARGSKLSFGEWGLKSLGVGWVSAAQIEAGRRAVTHHIKRGGKVWIRVFPDKPVTHKAAGVRMGSGKGEIEGYVAVVRPGQILFELAGVEEEIAKAALTLAARKMSVRTQLVRKE